MTCSPTAWTKVDIALAIATVAMVITTAINLLAPQGDGALSTALMIISTASLALVALLHSVRHLAVRNAAIYFAVIVVIELLLQQVNIWTGGQVFGNLIYPEGYFGLKFLDVPIAVPLAMCALNWPTFVMVNLTLFRRPVITVDDLGVWRSLLHCAVLATPHTAWSFSAEPMALANGILWRPPVEPGVGHWGVPMVEFREWWLMTFAQFAIFTIAMGRFVRKRPQPVFHRFLDVSPLLMYGGMALLLMLNPLNNDLGVGVLFSMGASTLIAMLAMSTHSRFVV